MFRVAKDATKRPIQGLPLTQMDQVAVGRSEWQGPKALQRYGIYTGRNPNVSLYPLCL